MDTRVSSRVYARGFDGLSESNSLGRVPLDYAYHMVSRVAEDAPDTAAVMERMYDSARLAEINKLVSDDIRSRALEENRGRLERLASRSGMTVPEILRVRAGGSSRELVEARAYLYRV